jgi:hypothetical protein
MSDLHPAVAFLLAAHAEAERCATTASDGQGWWLISPRAADHRSVVEYVIEGERGPVTHIDVDEHEPEAHLAEALLIQSNSPRAVLCRVAAEREILAEHAAGDMARERDETECRTCSEPQLGFSGMWAAEHPCRTVLGLAKAWGWEVKGDAELLPIS